MLRFGTCGKAANTSHKLANGITGRAAIATDHHALGVSNLQKGAHMALENLGSKGIAHDSADTRDRTHKL